MTLTVLTLHTVRAKVWAEKGAWENKGLHLHAKNDAKDIIYSQDSAATFFRFQQAISAKNEISLIINPLFYEGYFKDWFKFKLIKEQEAPKDPLGPW